MINSYNNNSNLKWIPNNNDNNDNDNAYIPILPISPRGSQRAHISSDLSKKTGIFPVKIVRN